MIASEAFAAELGMMANGHEPEWHADSLFFLCMLFVSMGIFPMGNWGRFPVP